METKSKKALTPEQAAEKKLKAEQRLSNRAKRLLRELPNFPLLDDEAFVRQPIVEAVFACSAASVWRGVKAGRIPQPHRIGPHSTGWKVGEVRAALARSTHPAAA